MIDAEIISIVMCALVGCGIRDAPQSPSPAVFAASAPPDAALNALSYCEPWAGGHTPAGVVWVQETCYTLAENWHLLDITAGTDAGVVRAYSDEMFVAQGGVLGATDAVINQKFDAELVDEHMTELDRSYRCRIGTVGCSLLPAHPECRFWGTRFADPAAPSQCLCGSGCLVRLPGAASFVSAQPDRIYGAPYGILVKASGLGNCVPVPCGVLAGDQLQLDTGICR